jgi:hypothetical protein
MTLDMQPAGIPSDQPDSERPADPRPAWERIAYTWLQREVDAGQPVDPATLAREVSVAPGFARDLLRVLRGQRDRDPELLELRGRLVRDRIADVYLRQELAGGGRLDPAGLAAEVGTSPAVARQWLAGLRAQHESPQGLEISASPSATAAPPQSSWRDCRRTSPPATTSRRRSPAAPPTPSDWPPRWNTTTGPARSAPASDSAQASSPGRWAATSDRSVSSSPSYAPGLRPLASASRSCGTPSSRTRPPGR